MGVALKRVLYFIQSEKIFYDLYFGGCSKSGVVAVDRTLDVVFSLDIGRNRTSSVPFPPPNMLVNVRVNCVQV